MAAITCFTDGSISEVVEGHKLFSCTNSHQFIIQQNIINTTVIGSVSSFVVSLQPTVQPFSYMITLLLNIMVDSITHYKNITLVLTVASFIKLL